MADELAKLPPEDEVAIVAMNIFGEDEKRIWLSDFTNDRLNWQLHWLGCRRLSKCRKWP